MKLTEERLALLVRAGSLPEFASEVDDADAELLLLIADDWRRILQEEADRMEKASHGGRDADSQR